jgi:hypothetical protein
VAVDEKRAHQRYFLWFPVVVEGASSVVAAVCHDASSGGIAINGSGPMEVGTEVTVVFRVAPDDEERHAKGRVVRIEPRSENPRDVWSHRMAIEFLEPQPLLQEIFKLRSSPPPAMP